MINRFKCSSKDDGSLVLLDPAENEEEGHRGGENDEDVGQHVKNNCSDRSKFGVFRPLQVNCLLSIHFCFQKCTLKLN